MKFIQTEINEQIGTITINRPDALNAMNLKVLKEMDQAFSELIADSKVGVIILTGAGEKAFIAGADIKLLSSMTPEDSYEFSKIGQSLTLKIESSPKPVIAAVNGFALGGGCELAIACHLRIASRNAQFAQPEVHLGIIPGWGGTQRLPRLIGAGLAAEWIVTGDMNSAEEAYAHGLVNDVVEPDQLMIRARKMAAAILKNGPEAIRVALECIRKGTHLPIEEALELEADTFKQLFGTPESDEGLKAFVEKRLPNFRS